MASDTVLAPEVLGRVQACGRADIVVGIPSYNNARTIAHVVRAAEAGLHKYFPGQRAVIINSDGGSSDGTPDVVRTLDPGDARLLLIAHPLSPVHRLTIPYHGIPGKGSAFRSIFRAADVLGARACAVVDADLRSMTPEWVHLLIAPVIDLDFDYVAPYYVRHKYDGTITNHIVYPLTRALYGYRVRQPIGGDFGLSARLARHYLAQPVWESDVARYGIDIWMTTTALCGGFRVCQAFLGAKLHDSKDPAADLSAMLVQVVGTVFSLMGHHEATWMAVEASQDVPLVGFRFDAGVEPVRVDLQRMLKRFRTGVADLRDVWKPVIGPAALARLVELAALDESHFHLPDDLWVQLVYDLAVAYHHRTIDREHLLRSSLPLYLGRVASFVREVEALEVAEVETRIEQLCLAFEAAKPSLVARWQTPERRAARGSQPSHAGRSGRRDSGTEKE